jgi:hypothetical protein
MGRKCKVCESSYREDIDLHILYGFSFGKVMEDFNPMILGTGEKPLNLKDLSLHKNKCLLPLSDANRELMERFGVELRGKVFVNPELNCHTIYRKDI